MADLSILEKYRHRFNVPDWRNKNDYAYVASLGQHQRRWEFLRRMGYYRSAWDTGDFASDLDFGLTEMYAPWARGDQLPEDFAFFDTSIVGNVIDLSALREIAESEGAGESFEAFVGERVIDLINHGYVLIPFDPGYPVKKQIAIATKALNGHKTAIAKSRINSSRVRTYDDMTLLRALDADNELKYLDRHHDAAPPTGVPTMTDIARIIFDKGLDIGDKSEGNAAHTYFVNAVKSATRMAERPILDRT